MQRFRKLSNLFKRGGGDKDPPLDPPDPPYDLVFHTDSGKPMYVRREVYLKSQPAKLKKTPPSSKTSPTEDENSRFPTLGGKPIPIEDIKAHICYTNLPPPLERSPTSSSEGGSSEDDRVFARYQTLPLGAVEKDVKPSENPSLFLNRKLNNYHPHSSAPDNMDPTSGGTLPRTRRPQADPRALGFAPPKREFEPNRGPPRQPFLSRPVARSDPKPPIELKRQLETKRTPSSTNMMYKNTRATASLGDILHSGPGPAFPPYPPPFDPRSRAQPPVKEVRVRTRSQTREPPVSASPPRPVGPRSARRREDVPPLPPLPPKTQLPGPDKTEERYISYSRVATAFNPDTTLPPLKSVVASQEVTVKPSNRGRASCHAEVLNNDPPQWHVAEVVPPLPKSALVKTGSQSKRRR